MQRSPIVWIFSSTNFAYFDGIPSQTTTGYRDALNHSQYALFGIKRQSLKGSSILEPERGILYPCLSVTCLESWLLS